MNIFVAGFNFGESRYQRELYLNKDYNAMADDFICRLPEIYSDAINLMGKEVVVIIVLPEYAFTSDHAIPTEGKKIILDALERAIREYKNIILIPGSFSTYDEFKNLSSDKINRRKNKVLNNYNAPYDHYDWRLNKANAESKLRTEMPNRSICLQNSAYILSSKENSKRIKHMKYFPIEEQRKLLSSFQRSNSFFYPGVGPEVQIVEINNQLSLDFNLIICADHHLTNNKIKENPPSIEVIVSDQITICREGLFGALNIQMDKKKGLYIYINAEHPKLSSIGEVKSFSYEINQYNEVEKSEIQLGQFSRNMEKPTLSQKIL